MADLSGSSTLGASFDLSPLALSLARETEEIDGMEAFNKATAEATLAYKREIAAHMRMKHLGHVAAPQNDLPDDATGTPGDSPIGL